MLIVEERIKVNGKPTIRLSKETNCYTYKRGSRIPSFNSGKDNIFIIETKVNSPNPNPKRKFTVSIRRDGIEKFQGEYLLSQISLEVDELQILKEAIEKIISNKVIN